MSELLRDLRFGMRLLAKNPVFATTAVLLLAVGISANTLIFSVVNALLLRPLPVAHPDNLVRLVEIHPNDFVTWEFPYSLCDAVASRETSLSDVICQGEADVPFSDGTSTERVRVHLVSPNFFSSLGVRAHAGRVLTAEDERTAAMNAVLSYDFWLRRFQGRHSVVGSRITLAGHPFTVVGVAPKAFNGLAVDTSPDIRVPAAVDRSIVSRNTEMNPTARPLFGEIFGRLRAGVPFERANTEADRLLHAAYDDELGQMFAAARGEEGARRVLQSRLRLESVANGVSTLRSQFSRALKILMAGVALLLLMVCANVSGLLMARSAAREEEMGIRLALGASRMRIVRQLLTEGLLPALLGGIAGTLLTRACLPLLVNSLPPLRDRAAVLQPLAVHVDIDVRVLGFSLGLMLLTVVLFALSPALRSAPADIQSTLKAGRRTTRRLLSRNWMVVIQVALCTVILLGAAALVETLARMRSMNAGFDRGHIVTFTVDPTLRGYTPEQSRALSNALLQKARALPGVASASIASRPVMRGTGLKGTLAVAGTQIKATDFLNSSLNSITPGYFETMGIHVLAGRDFNWFDRNRMPPHKAIVNQTFARRFFPGRNPIGERIGSPGPNGVARADDAIIGVVSDAKYRSLREPVPPTVYGPVVDGFESGFILYVRTYQRPAAMTAPIREVLRSLDPGLPFIEIQTLQDEVEASLWQERLLAWLSSMFGAIATLLASIGLYGALDYALKFRTREIGVRMALGAQPARIVGLFSADTLVLIATGIVVGLCIYAAAAIGLRRVVYDVHTWEPAVVALVVLIVGLVAVMAAGPVAYRAVRIDPASALRAE